MLKQTGFILLLCMALSSHLLAQKKFDWKNLHYSGQMSFNVSWFTGRVGPFNAGAPGYTGSEYAAFNKYVRISHFANLSVDYPLTEKFGVAVGLIYLGRGGAYQAQVTNVEIHADDGDVVKDYNNYNFKIDYLEIPILAQYNLGNPESKNSYLLYGGVAPAVKVASAIRYKYYPTTSPTAKLNETSLQTLPLNNVNTFNLHPIIGMQFGDNRNSNEFFIDLRLEYSLFPVFNAAGRAAYFDSQMFSASLGLGLRFL